MKKQPGMINTLWFKVLTWVIVMGAALGLTLLNASLQEDKMQADFLQQVKVIRDAVDLNTFQHLTGTRADMNTPHYQRLKQSLVATRRIFPKMRFIYLMGERAEGDIYFYVDSEPQGLPDESQPGDLYTEASADLKAVFSNHQPALEGPVTDRWGTWVSGYQPIVDPFSGDVVVVVGADIDAENWVAVRNHAILLPTLVLVLLVLISGMVLFFPFIQHHQPVFFREHAWSSYVMVVCTGLLGIGVTFLLVWYATFFEDRSQQQIFDEYASTRTERLSASLRELDQMGLEGLKKFFEGSEFVDRQEFALYSEYLIENPYVAVWAWAPETLPEDVPAIEQRARDEGLSDYQVWDIGLAGTRLPVQSDEVIYPVLYVAPHNPQNPVLGFNLLSENLRRAAIHEAVSSGLSTATEPIYFMHGTDERLGFVVFKSVLPGFAPDAQAGVLAAAVQVDQLLRLISGIGSQDNPISTTDFVQIFVEDQPRVLFSNALDSVVQIHITSNLQEHPRAEFTHIKPVYVFGKTYMIVEHPSPAFFQVYPDFAGKIVGIAGGILTLLLMLLVGFYTNRNLNLESTVSSRTAALRESEWKLLVALKNAPMVVYQQDRDLRYTWIHNPQASEESYMILGKTDEDLLPASEAEKLVRLKRKVLEAGTGGRQTLPLTIDHRTVYYDLTIEPIHNASGDVTGIACSSMDITEQITRVQAAERNLARLRKINQITQQQTKDIQAFLDDALNAAIELTDSKMGYIYFFDEETNQFTLNSWSKEVMKACTVQESQTVYELEKTGLWGEAVRQRQPILINDFEADHPLKKGYPEGHVHLQRLLTVPIFQDEHIVAVVGVANKAGEYDQSDVLQLTLLMDSVWKMVAKAEADRAMLESTARFKKLVDASPDGIFVQVQHRFAYINPAALASFGAENAQALLDTPVLERFHPDDHRRIKDRIGKLILAKESVPLIEERYLRMDGTAFPVEVSAVPIRWEHQDGALVFFQDITGRKKSEETMLLQSTALDSANLAIVIMDDTGTIEWVNPAFSQLTGYGQDESVGKSIHDLIYSGQQDESFFQEMWSTARSGESWQGELVNRKKNGELYTEELNLTPVYADDGKIRHFVEFKKDITEIKQAQLRQQQRLEELEAQRTINQAIAGIFGLQITLEIICAQALNLFSADAVGILLYSPPNQTLTYAAGDGFRLDAYQESHYQLDEGFAGKVAFSRKTIQIGNLNQDPASFEIPSTVDQEGFRCYTGIPLIAKGELKGVMEIFHRKPFAYDEHWLNLVESINYQVAVAIDDEQLYAKLNHQNVNLFKAYNATIEGWSRALELRDRETEGHTLRVANITLLLAKQMGIRDDELVQIRRGALLHDIGKIGVPDSILLKPGKLTDEEWVIMKKHPEFAFKLLSPIEYLRLAVDIPFCHHEKWDGSGYPRGLKGHQIPLSARIFAVIDVWDALRSDRPYRKAWPEDRVMDYIKSQSGTHFDPDVVDVFFEVQEEIQTMAA